MAKTNLRKNLEGYIFISPWIVGFFMFIIGPMSYALYLSLFEWDVLSPPKFAGFMNYLRAVKHYRFWTSFKVTFYFVFTTVPLRVFIGLVLALMIRQLIKHKLKGTVVFRSIFCLPIMFSGVVLGILWAWIYEPEYGILNDLLRRVGIKGPNWLATPGLVMPSIIAMMGWWIGGMMLIFLAGLLDIPEEMYEVAEIDGASWWQKFIRITIPMLSPTLFFNFTATLIQSFQIFGPIYVLTRGGPANLSLVYVVNLYREGFELFHMGYACTLAWILFAIVIAFTAFLFRTSKLWVFYRAR